MSFVLVSDAALRFLLNGGLLSPGLQPNRVCRAEYPLRPKLRKVALINELGQILQGLLETQDLVSR